MKMLKVKVSSLAYELIRKRSTTYTLSSGTQLPDGNWLVELSPDTVARLEEHGYVYETVSDTIERLFSPKN